MTARRALIVVLALVAAACTGSREEGGTGLNTTFSAQMASSWHWTGDPQRVQVGIFASDAEGIHVVSGGAIDLAFAYVGTDGGSNPVPGPSAPATYIPVPGTEPGGDRPAISAGARGVYEAEDVVFDDPGIWRVTVSAEIDGVARELTADLVVTPESPIPAPGDPAPATENLTIDSDVREGAIDSMADAGAGIPDPELHRWTVAEAIRQGRPALVLIGTPAYCTSLFCGPEVQELQRFAAEYPDRAVYIHIEVWKDYRAEPQVVNEGAAEWLLRDGNMTEPWLFLIGADGRIADRWGSLFDSDEVIAALEALPAMGP
jgi:hypothetical protein